MAMTAWAAKFLTKPICLSVKGRTSWRIDSECTDQFVFLEHRNSQKRPNARQVRRATTYAGSRSFKVALRLQQIGNVDYRFVNHATK